MRIPIGTQYLRLKQSFPDALLLFRCGDVYEPYDEDAAWPRELSIMLTVREFAGGERVVLCSLHDHAVDGSIKRLARRGYKVANAKLLAIGASLIPSAGLARTTVTVVVRFSLFDAGPSETARGDRARQAMPKSFPGGDRRKVGLVARSRDLRAPPDGAIWVRRPPSTMRRQSMADTTQRSTLPAPQIVDPLDTPLLIAVPDAARLLGIGTTFAWELVRAGNIPSIKLGRRVLIPRAALESLAATHLQAG